MKNVICILALLCTVQVSKQDIIDPTRNLQRMVNRQKKAAQAILDDLLNFEKQTKQNFETRLNGLKADASLRINNIINIAFEDINEIIEKGKEENKIVTECHDYAKSNLETKNENVFAELELCVQNGHTILEAPLTNVAKSIEAAQKLLTDLDAIIPSCYSSSFVKMQACVRRNLFLSRSSLKRIDDNAREVIRAASNTYTKAISDARSCMTKPIADVRSYSTDVIVRTNSCIRNAPTITTISPNP